MTPRETPTRTRRPERLLPSAARVRRTLGVAAVAALALAAVSERAAAEERIRIALLPIVVHSAESPDYVRSGLADMLASRLERVPDFEVVRVDELDDATTNLDKALRVARKNDAQYVIFGSFTRFGTGASLDIQCSATDHGQKEEPLRDIFVHSGSLGDVIPDLDDLVGKVARFVVEGYVEQSGGTAAAAAGLPSTRELGELRARIASLEESLRRLTERLESARVLPPSDTGAGAPPAPSAPAARASGGPAQ